MLVTPVQTVDVPDALCHAAGITCLQTAAAAIAAPSRMMQVVSSLLQSLLLQRWNCDCIGITLTL